MQFMVFDDDGPTDEFAYLGSASVPLLPLIHDKPITGSFEVYLGDQKANIILHLLGLKIAEMEFS